MGADPLYVPLIEPMLRYAHHVLQAQHYNAINAIQWCGPGITPPLKKTGAQTSFSKPPSLDEEGC